MMPEFDQNVFVLVVVAAIFAACFAAVFFALRRRDPLSRSAQEVTQKNLELFVTAPASARSLERAACRLGRVCAALEGSAGSRRADIVAEIARLKARIEFLGHDAPTSAEDLEKLVALARAAPGSADANPPEVIG